MKFKLNDKVYNAYRESEFREGIVCGVTGSSELVIVEYEDSKETTNKSLLILSKDKSKYKYVLKRYLLDEMYPYDPENYAKVKVIK